MCFKGTGSDRPRPCQDVWRRGWVSKHENFYKFSRLKSRSTLQISSLAKGLRSSPLLYKDCTGEERIVNLWLTKMYKNDLPSSQH